MSKTCKHCHEKIPEKAKKCKHCGSDQRNWFLRHKIVSAILIFVIVGLIGNALPKAPNTSYSPNKQTSSTPSTQSSAQEEEKEKEWEKVFDLTTATDKQSDSFMFQGGKQKIEYKTDGGSMLACYVYVMKEGTSLDVQGGFPEIMISEPDSGETMMRKGAGEYYLDIKSANGTCAVKIYELR